MATNAPPSRKTHVTRICFRDRAGARIDDKYIDVERMDIVRSAMQIPPLNQWQGTQRKLCWGDDPDSDGYFPEGLPSRQTEIVKVCDPSQEDDVDDPEEYAELRVIKSMRSGGGGGDASGRQNFMDRFLTAVTNAELSASRIIERRTIVHHDTNVDDQAQAAFDADPERFEYVVPGEFYTKVDGSKDDSQSVDHEIITYIKPSGNSALVMGEARQTKLLNQYLIDESEPYKGDVIGQRGFNPPYRLDPFQNIVNVKLGEPDQQVMASWKEESAEPSVLPVTDNFGDNVSGATIGDLTVFSQGYVASGRIELKPKVKKVVYLQAEWKPEDDESATQVFLGEKSGEGVIWTPVFSAGGRVTAISHGNDRFFVTYLKNSTTFVAMTINGRSFSISRPWAGADGAPSGSANVAYLKDADMYVTVGTKLVAEDVTVSADVIHEDLGCNEGYTETVFDTNLAWATSRDGHTWRTGFSPNVYAGIGGGGGTGSAVAAGNGVFVTGAGKKNVFPALTPCCPPGSVIFTCCVGTFPFPDYRCNTLQAQRPDYVLNSAAVAVSSNGVDWTLAALPGAIVDSTEDGDTASNGTLVVFVKHKRDEASRDPKIKGFFVAASRTHSSIESGPIQGNLYKSENGSDWVGIETKSDSYYYYLSAIAEELARTVQK